MGAPGADWGQHWVGGGGQQRYGGGGNSGVGGGVSQPLRTALHAISISLQNSFAETELKGSKST